LGREPSILSRRELALQQAEALARQRDVLHHVFQMLICIREMIIQTKGCKSLPRKVIMQRTKLASSV
jgi:hypothetical protein